MKRKHSVLQNEGFGTAAIIGIIAVLALGGIFLATGNKDAAPQPVASNTHGDAMEDDVAMDDTDKTMQDAPEAPTEDIVGAPSMEDKGMMDEKDAMADKAAMDDDTTMQKPDAQEMVTGSYEVYAPEKLALAEDGNVVLFFHATWCPSCRALDSAISKEVMNIPDGTHILKLDYDSSVELRKKYSVTTQHTLVQVDKDGNKITMWSGGSTLDAVLGKIQ